MKVDHDIEFSGSNWAFPLLVFSLVGIALLLFDLAFGQILARFGFGNNYKLIEVDEDLPDFFDAIR